MTIHCSHCDDKSFCDYLGFCEDGEITQEEAAINELNKYFRSGNDVPVDRVVIKAEDYFRITGQNPDDFVTKE